MKKFAFLMIIIGSGATVGAEGGSNAPGGISAGAMIGLAATWFGIVLGYTNLRRSLKKDAEEQMGKIADKIAHDLFSARSATLMDRKEQEAINRHNDERYKALADVRQLCDEIRMLAHAARQAVSQSAGRSQQQP